MTLHPLRTQIAVELDVWIIRLGVAVGYDEEVEEVGVAAIHEVPELEATGIGRG